MSITKPTILLVPGSFAPAKFYDNIVARYTARGYLIKVVELVTVTKKDGALPTMYDDAAVINAEATKLADEGKDIVLIGHSYGGIPTSQAIEGISKASREKAGKKGGVVKVGYMTALVPALGGNAATLMEGAPSGYIRVDEETGWMFQNDVTEIASITFNDLPVDERLKWAKQFTQHSSVSFANELTYAGYNDVPAYFLFCENDKCVPPESQQKSIDNIEKESGKKVHVTKIPTDHVPIAAPEAQDKVIGWWMDLVEKSSEE